MSSGSAQALSMAKTGHFVDLEFGDRREDWHVNDRIGVGSGETENILTQLLDDDVSGTATLGMVLQKADASEEWLVITIEQSEDGDVQFGDTVYAKRTPESREPIEDDIEVHHVAANMAKLAEERSNE